MVLDTHTHKHGGGARRSQAGDVRYNQSDWPQPNTGFPHEAVWPAAVPDRQEVLRERERRRLEGKAGRGETQASKLYHLINTDSCVCLRGSTCRRSSDRLRSEETPETLLRRSHDDNRSATRQENKIRWAHPSLYFLAFHTFTSIIQHVNK